jgi:hypothetical protein
MVALLLEVERGRVHAQATIVASAVPKKMAVGFECGVIEKKS